MQHMELYEKWSKDIISAIDADNSVELCALLGTCKDEEWKPSTLDYIYQKRAYRCMDMLYTLYPSLRQDISIKFSFNYTINIAYLSQYPLADRFIPTITKEPLRLIFLAHRYEAMNHAQLNQLLHSIYPTPGDTRIEQVIRDQAHAYATSYGKGLVEDFLKANQCSQPCGPLLSHLKRTHTAYENDSIADNEMIEDAVIPQESQKERYKRRRIEAPGDLYR